MDPDRRVTLGPISQNSLNMRAASRMSMVPDTSSMKSSGRMSMGVPANRVVGMQNMQVAKKQPAPAPRKSMLPQRTNTTMLGVRVSDPRNIGDKQFFNDSIRRLLKYLAEHNFDYSINPKILSRPSNKDFSNIILFLFKQYDSNFTFTGKFEDEVVAMFKQMGYPCQISKANITSAGTPHAWPSILAACIWLVEMLECDELITMSLNGMNNHMQDNNIVDDQNNIIHDKQMTQTAFYNYLSQAYTFFMMGDDNRYDDIERKFIQNFETKNVLIKDEIVAMEQRNQMLVNDIEQIEQRRNYIPELEKKKKEYVNELNKYQYLMEQLEKQKVQLQSKVYSRQVEVDKLTASIHVLNDDINNIKLQISTQELSPEDVRRMTIQREQLESAQAQAYEYKLQQQDKVQQLEQSLREKVESLSDISRNYNHIAEDLKLIPTTARNARGKNFALEVDIRAKKRDLLLKTDVRSELVPPLQSMRKEVIECSTSLKNDIIIEKESEEELITKLHECKEMYAHSCNKVKKLEEVLKKEKEIFEQNDQVLTQEINMLETKLLQLKDYAVYETRITLSIKHIEELQQKQEQARSQYEIKRNSIMESILDVITQCANFRETAQQQLQQIKGKYNEKLEQCLWSTGIHGELKKAIEQAKLVIQNKVITTTTDKSHSNGSNMTGYTEISKENMENNRNTPYHLKSYNKTQSTPMTMSKKTTQHQISSTPLSTHKLPIQQSTTESSMIGSINRVSPSMHEEESSYNVQNGAPATMEIPMLPPASQVLSEIGQSIVKDNFLFNMISASSSSSSSSAIGVNSTHHTQQMKSMNNLPLVVPTQDITNTYQMVPPPRHLTAYPQLRPYTTGTTTTTTNAAHIVDDEDDMSRLIYNNTPPITIPGMYSQSADQMNIKYEPSYATTSQLGSLSLKYPYTSKTSYTNMIGDIDNV